jgi:LIVCS family branched-chain amino acid:cation transporter
MGIAPFVPLKYQGVVMFVFSPVFFGLAYFLTVKESGLLKWVGKYLNPLFLGLLLVVLVLSLVLPMGDTHQAVSAAYQVMQHSKEFWTVTIRWMVLRWLALAYQLCTQSED